MLIEVPTTQSVSIVSVSGQALADADQTVDGAFLTVKVGTVRYQLPADLINIESIAKGWSVPAGDVQLTIIIEKKTGAEAEAIVAAIKAQGGEMIGDAYDFRIIAQSGTHKLEFKDFGNRYVNRLLQLPKTISNKATAVVIDPQTGEMNFVPARFIQDNGTTTAVIKRTGNSVYAVALLNQTFADTKGHWAQTDIDLLASKLLVKGVSDNTFAPDQAITRAEFATLLVRALGLTKAQKSTSFSDVHAAEWYSEAIATASGAGLIQGYEDGTFRPNQVISREELAVLAARAFDFAKVNLAAGTSAELNKFADAKTISTWAQAAVVRTVSEGIMNGVQDSIFAPQDHTSRAQAAVMLKRLAIKLSLMD
ncbi:Endo-1,4-beta-xylanase A precursor [compost metagenome]